MGKHTKQNQSTRCFRSEEPTLLPGSGANSAEGERAVGPMGDLKNSESPRFIYRIISYRVDMGRLFILY